MTGTDQASRFRVYDVGGPGDRYTIVDRAPVRIRSQNIRFYLGMDAHPFHPQGIGQHGEFNETNWRECSRVRFRNLGKRIKLEELPPEALRAARQFIHAQEQRHMEKK